MDKNLSLDKLKCPPEHLHIALHTVSFLCTSIITVYLLINSRMTMVISVLVLTILLHALYSTFMFQTLCKKEYDTLSWSVFCVELVLYLIMFGGAFYCVRRTIFR